MSAAQGFTFSLICVLVSLQSHLITCDALCYFPTELQGEFLMQSSAGGMGKSEIQYSYVNITGDSIPIWGICYRRIGSNYILLDSSSGDNCIRCFHLTLKSRNVLLVRTEGLGKCYTSEAAAEATCLHSMTHHMTELLLFKEREVGGEEISKAFCPVHGKFTFVYNIDDGTEDKMECASSDSVIDSCMIPIQASSISLHFQGCSFGDVDNLTFHCLGDWEGPGNQRYVAFLNPSEGSNGRPRYRCALYHTDSSGKVFIAFSSDSTCTSNLYNSTTGYETMVLTPSKEQEYPPKVLMSVCRFPAWMQGTWEHLNVNGQIMSFADHSSFRMYQIRCIGTPNPATNYFPVFIRDECGGEAYNCIWVEKRASNVLEFQLGMNPSAVYNESLCINSNFPNKEWITQGRLDRLDESPCPITGEYTGLIPDNSGLCAKLSSDCKSKEIMYYTMSECVGKNIYEGRITKISRSKRETESSLDDKVYHVTNPRPSSTMQSELDSTSPSSPTTLIQSSPTPPIQYSPTISISTSRPFDSTTVQLEPIHSTTDQSKSTENENPKSSTTTLKPAENLTSYDTPSVEIRYPTERSEVNVPSSSINTPFYSLENKGAGSTINQEPRNVHQTSETTSRSTSSSNEASSLGTTSVKDLPRNGGMSRGNISTDKHELEFNKSQSTNSDPRSQLEETRNTDLRRSDPTTAVAYFSNNSSFDQLGFRISNHRDQVTDYPNARRVTDFNTNYQPRQNYGTTTRINPITFHGSISEIPFQGGFGYPNKPHRQPPPLGPTVPTQYSYNRNSWMDQNNGYPQFRVRQEPGRYIDPNPFLATTMNPDVRRAWEMRVAESHPIFVSNNRKILPTLPRTPVALPPIQIPNPNFSSNSRRLPLASSTANPLREERDYRCLGQWEEDGLMYTYTQRRDIGTYECFVGSIISDTEIYIKEAGEHCERSVNPLHLGMKLTNKGKCTDGQHNPIPSDTGFRQTPYPPHPTMWHSTRQPYVTKPWKPITAPPRIRNEVLNGGHVSTHASNPFIAFCASVLFVFYTYTSLS